MNAQDEKSVPARPVKPFDQRSLSGGLSIALAIAQLVLLITFVFAAVAAVVGITMIILVATHVLSAQVLNAPGRDMLRNWTIAVPYLVYAVVAARGALLIVRRLQRVFASFVVNDPFARDNATHLRAIWVTLIVIEISRIAGWVLTHALTATFASTATVTFPHEFDHPVDLVRLFLIFVVLVMAEVFREGTLLREETKLTV